MHKTIDKIESAVLDCLRLAEETFKIDVGVPNVTFDLKGMTNGMIEYKQIRYMDGIKVGKDFKIRFNIDVAMHNLDRFLTETVPHEIAHYVDVLIRGTSQHDGRWRRICLALGGSGQTCTSYDRSMLPNMGKTRQQRRWRYTCGCMEHQITTVRHNKIVRGHAEYTCKHCNQIITKA